MSMDIYVNLKSAAESAKAALDRAARSTTKLGRETKETNAGMAKFFSNLKKTNNQFTNIAKDANRAGTSLSGFGKAVKGLATLGGIYALANSMKMAVQSAMDMIETQNLFQVALGDSYDEADKFLSKMSAASGMDLTNLRSATGTFALLGRSMGMTTDQAEILSTTSTQLGLDLASLVNVPVAQALGDIKSGLVGQTETMYKYGVDLTEASLKEEALAEGISKSVRQMSQGEKMALRYNLMLKQTALTHGDFARTIESPANQVKILSERLVTAGRAIGTMFIPALTVILPIANAVLIIVTKLANALAALFGYTPPQFAPAKGIGNISADADDATDAVGGTTKALKKLKDTALGFDELNTIEKDTSSGSGGGASAGGADAIAGMKLDTYDSGLSGIKSKADAYAQAIQDAFSKISFANFLNSIDNLKKALEPLGETLGKGLYWFLYNVLVPISTWTMEDAVPAFLDVLTAAVTKLTDVIVGFQPQWNAIWTSFFVPLANWTGGAVVQVFQDLERWIQNLNFEPLVNSFVNLADSAEPFAENIGDGLMWFYEKVLLPLGSYVISDALPAFLNALSGAIDALNAVINTLKPLFSYLWTNVLQPIASWTGGAIVDILNGVGTALTKVSDWISQNQGIVSGATQLLAAFFAVWEVSGITQFLVEAGGVAPAIAAITTKLIASTAAKVADRVAAMALAGEYLSNLVKSIVSTGIQVVISTAEWIANTAAMIAQKVAVIASTVALWAGVAAQTALNAILLAGTAVATGFGAVLSFLAANPIVLVIAAIAALVAGIVWLIKNWNDVKTTAEDVWKHVQEAWKPVADWFKTNVSDPVGKVFKGMVNGVIGAFEWMLNGIVDGLDSFIGMVNGICMAINAVADKLGFSVDLHLNPIDHVKLPRLATGGILKMGTLFEAGEFGKAEMLGNYKGNTTVMPLENTDFVQAMYDAVASAISDTQESGGQVIENVLTLDGEVIYKNQQKVSQKRGQNFGLGAFAR